MSSVIPDDLIVDDLIHIDDFLHDQWERLWEGVRRSGGVMHPDILSSPKVSSDLFKTPEDAFRLMHRAGFRPLDERSEGRMTRGFTGYTWTGPDGDRRIAFVQQSVPDPIERLRKVFLDILEFEPTDIVAVPRGNMDNPLLAQARKRDADGVDKRIGLPEARGEVEFEREGIIGKDMLKVEETDMAFGVRRYLVGAGVAGRWLQRPEIESLYAIEDHWRAKGGLADDVAMPLISGGAGQVIEGDEVDGFEKMGSAVRDADPLLATG